MLLYCITDRVQFPGTERERWERVLERVTEAASSAIDFIQLREKDLPAAQLEFLARAAVEKVRSFGGPTRLLINSRTDVALAVGADGVHLRSKDVTPTDVRRIWRLAGRKNDPVIAVSCHTDPEVVAAKEQGADFVVFGPVFEKKNAPATQATRLEQLAASCRHGIPVLALGGITIESAASCIQAGAAGIAGIRLFQSGDLRQTVKRLRSLTSG